MSLLSSIFLLGIYAHRIPHHIHVSVSHLCYIPLQLLQCCSCTQSKKSETAPITAKQVAAEIVKAQPKWEVPERRVAKFVKREVGGRSAIMSEGKKSGKFKLTSPFGKSKKKKAVAADAAAVKKAVEAAPDASAPAKDAVAAVETKVEKAASPAKSEAAADAEQAPSPKQDAYSEDKEDTGPEPWCSSCAIS